MTTVGCTSRSKGGNRDDSIAMVLVLGAAGRHQKHAHESAFLLLKEHLKMRKGPRILALISQALRLKTLVPSWHNESYCGVFSLSPEKVEISILAILASSIVGWVSFSLSEIEL